MEKVADLVEVSVKHTFSDTELKEQSTLLAQAVKNKAGVESDKKVAMAGFTNSIKILDAEINQHSSNINNGYFYRDEPCELFLDYDTNERIYKSRHSGEEVKREAFYSGDYQRKLAFDEQQEQIAQNNEAGDYAEGDAIDKVIEEKKQKRTYKKKAGEAVRLSEIDVDPEDDFPI